MVDEGAPCCVPPHLHEWATPSVPRMSEQLLPPKEVFLFLGAGASICASVPDTVSFLHEFKKEIASDLELKSTLTGLQATILKANQVEKIPDPPDIESVLETIQLIQRGSKIGLSKADASPSYATSPESSLVRLKTALQVFIRKRCLVKPEATRPLDGLRRILYDYNAIHVFTVNYDVVFELLAQRHGLPTTDGFQSSWAPATFDQEPPKVCIYKLHGSAIWYRTPTSEFIRLPLRSAPEELELLSGERPEPLMLYPAQKLEYSGPFIELLIRFQACLKRAAWFVVVGYSFRDEHINNMFREAAAENRLLRLVLISPSAESIYRNKLATTESGSQPSDPNSPEALFPSSLSGRVVRLPFKFERVAQDFSDLWFDKIQSALTARDQARMDALYAKPVDWQVVALNLAQAGILDGLEELEDKRFSISELGDLQRLLYFSSKALVAASLGQWALFRKEWRKVVDTLRTSYVDRLGFQWHTGAPSPAFFLNFTIWHKHGTNEIQESRAGASIAVGELSHMRLHSKRYADYVRVEASAEPLCLMDSLLAQLEVFWELYNSGFVTIDQFLLTRGDPTSPAHPESRAKWKEQIDDWINGKRPANGDLGEGAFKEMAKRLLDLERDRIKKIFEGHERALEALGPTIGWIEGNELRSKH